MPSAGDLVVNLRMNNQSLLKGFSGSARATEDYSQRLLRNTSALGGLDSAMDRHVSALVQETRVRQQLNQAVFQADDAIEQSSSAMQVNQGVVSNLAFAVEDMSSVYGTQGLAGAVRAGANNFTMIASVMGPQALLVTSLASAVLQLGLAYTSAADQAEESAKRQEKALEGLDRSLDRSLREIEGVMSIDIGDMTSDQMQERMQEIDRQQEISVAKGRAIRDQIRDLEEQRLEVQQQLSAPGNETLPDTDPLRQQMESLTQRIEERWQRIEDLGVGDTIRLTEREQLRQEIPVRQRHEETQRAEQARADARAEEQRRQQEQQQAREDATREFDALQRRSRLQQAREEFAAQQPENQLKAAQDQLGLVNTLLGPAANQQPEHRFNASTFGLGSFSAEFLKLQGGGERPDERTQKLLEQQKALQEQIRDLQQQLLDRLTGDGTPQQIPTFTFSGFSGSATQRN